MINSGWLEDADRWDRGDKTDNSLPKFRMKNGKPTKYIGRERQK